MVDQSGKPLNGFNASAAVSVSELAGTLSTNMVDIRDGISQTPLSFTPYFVSQDNVKLSVQVLGVGDVSGNEFSIHPERPIRI